MVKSNTPHYLNSEISTLIDELIHSERDRDILKKSMIHHVTYEKIAEEKGLSPRWVGTIVRRWRPKLETYLS